MLIWRVENNQGNGCYNFLYTKPLLERHVGSEEHPLPVFDKGIKRPREHGEICGFLTLHQALSWFTSDELELLEKKGFQLKKVEVKVITAFGEKQILARR